MTKINKFLSGVAMSLLTSTSIAQPKSGVYAVDTQIQCSDRDTINTALKNWKETLVAQMKTTKSDGTERNAGFYINAKDGSWSLVEVSADGVFCLLATGVDMKPVQK